METLECAVYFMQIQANGKHEMLIKGSLTPRKASSFPFAPSGKVDALQGCKTLGDADKSLIKD
jgi:hypothetical protein